MAIIKPSFDRKRQYLRDIIPLAAPFHIGIEPTRYCNLKCFFCQQSTRGDFNDLFIKKGQSIKHMEFSLYQKIIEDIMALPEQPKKIQLVGMGEPILNPELGRMIRYLRSEGFKGRIVTYTNGLALTPEISDELTESGLTSIQISVYGITTDDFIKLAGKKVNIEHLIKNLDYLYKNKKSVQIRLKTTDDVTSTEEKRALFFDRFNNLCDQIFIEHIINIPQQMGHNDVGTREITQYSELIQQNREICPWMFYQAHINSDGDVFFCDILAKPKQYSIGNITEQSLIDIWNSSIRRGLLCTALREGQDAIEQCVGCDDRYSMTVPEEYLDNCRKELLLKLEDMGS